MAVGTLVLTYGLGLMFQQRAVFVAQPAIEERLLTGFTRPCAAMTITSEVAGRCQRVFADVGNTIAADGIYARLDGTFTKLDLDRNRADQKRLESRIAYLEQEVNRFANLLEKRTISQSNYDDMAQALDQARLELDSLRVNETYLSEQLQRFSIAVPAGWTVEERLLEPGQWVTVGAVLGRIGDYHRLEVPFALDAEELSQIETAGEKLTLILADEGGDVPATIAHVSPAFDPVTRKSAVTLAIGPQMAALRGGIRVQLRLVVAAKGRVVALPREAVEQRYDTYWLTRESGERLRVQVTAIKADGTYHLAHDALQVGDRFLARSESPP